MDTRDIRDKIEGEEKSTKAASLDTSLDISKTQLLQEDGETLTSPRTPANSPRSGSPRPSGGLKRSPRLIEAMRTPSPPREEEFKDAHDQVTRRKSSGSFDAAGRKRSGSFSFKVVRVKSEGEAPKEEASVAKTAPGATL